MLHVSSHSYKVSFDHLGTLTHSIFSILKLQPEKIAVHLLFFAWCLYLLGASTSAPACPCRLMASQRPPFAQRLPVKWDIHKLVWQLCFQKTWEISLSVAINLDIKAFLNRRVYCVYFPCALNTQILRCSLHYWCWDCLYLSECRKA